jgi:hypothetical protein
MIKKMDPNTHYLNNSEENENDFYRKKYESLHYKSKYIYVSYKKLYDELYKETFNKMIHKINNSSFEYSYNIFLLDYENLKPFSESDIHQILYALIYTESKYINKNAFIDYIFENEDININYVYKQDNKNKCSLLMLSIQYDNVYLFDKLMSFENIDYNYIIEEENVKKFAIHEAIKIVHKKNNDYYFNKLLYHKDLYKKSMINENIIGLFIGINKNENNIIYNILEKIIYHEDFIFEKDLLFHISYLNDEDIIFDIIKALCEKYKKTIQKELKDNVYHPFIFISLLQDSYKTIDYFIDFIFSYNQPILNEIFNESELYEKIIEKRDIFKGKCKKSELYNTIYNTIQSICVKLENICNKPFHSEVICKNKYTCNICLDEASENHIYKKCTTCNVIFHNDCLIDYFESCSTKKCCYCQNQTTFNYLLK